MNFLLFALALLAVAAACPPCCEHPRCPDEHPCPCSMSKKPAPSPPEPNCGKRCNEKPCSAHKVHKLDNYGGKDWFLPYVSPLQRFYSERYRTHHYHTEPGPISSFLADTYHIEPSPGRMITVRSYNQQKHEIRRHCPFLVPLYTAINTKTKSQKITTNVAQLNRLMEKGGWYKLQQIGYCVKGKKCRATKGLVELHIKHILSDILYTSDTNEIGVVNNRNDFGGTATSPLCYLWL
ncbi:unnamed protein product [Cylicocyclus nassatus]|uniref:DUF5648 domain-containing protein n=1 Tax=Cylicocyclus nassatus TaxID=53992 RepID=A0AA36HBI2_CYLNA|nr:unnamed protein product [Cylicocyclus nassatus]